jgi:hypothetical protein
MGRSVVRLCLAVLLGCPLLASAGTPRTAEAAPEQWCFPQTAQCIVGRFLAYWREHGELAINGYPLSAERREVLEDGKEYTVQYFERVRMEYHPESAPPYDVLLGQFGRGLHPVDPPVAPLPGATHFPETGHNVTRAEFLAYWQANGGLTQFGYPVSEEFAETLEDGGSYRVQYFERARFEWHPENGPGQRVLLGQFGRRILGVGIGEVGSIVYLDSDRRTARRMRPDGTPLAPPFSLTLGQYDTVIYFSVNRTLTTAVYSYIDAASQSKTTIVQLGRGSLTSDELLSPRWSPDGRYLLANRWLDHQAITFEDVLYDSQTGTLTSLGPAHFPGWDLDSQHLVYADAGNIFRMPIIGGSPVKLTNLPDGAWRVLSAHALAGGRLAFDGSPRQDPADYRWWSLESGGATPTPLGENEEKYGESTRYPYNEAIHPLGTWLAYTATAAGGACITPGQALQDRPKVIHTTISGQQYYHLDRDDGFNFSPDEGMEFDQYSWSPVSDWLALGLLTFRCDPQTYGRPTVREPAVYLWTAYPAPGEAHLRRVASGWYPTRVP